MSGGGLLSGIGRATLVIGCWLLVSPAAEAQCTISATGVNFGPYDVFEPTPTDSNGTIQYQCHGSVREVRVSLGPGSGTFAARTLRRGAETLGYNLFRDAARTEVWGDGSAGTGFYFVRNAAPQLQTLTVYGRIEAQQDVTVGVYTDTVVVSIDF